MSRSIGDGLRQLGRRSRPLWAVPGRCVVQRAVLLQVALAEGPRPWTAGVLARPGRVPARAYSARALDRVEHGEHVQHVSVPCASSGSIIVSLYHVREHPPTTPVLLYLPPSPQPPIEASGEAGGDAQEAASRAEALVASLQQPPDFLLRQNFPVATIRYRWSATAHEDRQEADKVPAPSYLWPTPLHDVLFAYDWIRKHLAPPLSASVPGRSPDGRRHYPRRDLYVYGSHLGAGLAAALALTETHPQHRVAIRGVAAYNGIYNWTAFVATTADGIPVADDAASVDSTTPGVPALPSLFHNPADLFDSFASPALFFRTTGHLMPPADFDKDENRRQTEEEEMRLEEKEESEGQPAGGLSGKAVTTQMIGTTRKAYLGFPPLQSTLAIPSALLLHTSAPTSHSPSADKPKRARKTDAAAGVSARPRKIPEAASGNNSFAVQADELACLMRRGIDKVEIKRRRERHQPLIQEYSGSRDDDGDADVRSSESEQRVRIAGVGAAQGGSSLDLSDEGQKKLLAWLDEHMSGRSH